MNEPARQSFERPAGQQVLGVSPWVYGRLSGIRDLMAEERQRRVTYTEVLEVLLTAWDTQARQRMISYDELEEPGMSIRERRNRKDCRAKTPAQLHAGRCGICMAEIKPGEPIRPVPQGSGQAHLICPEWPPA